MMAKAMLCRYESLSVARMTVSHNSSLEDRNTVPTSLVSSGESGHLTGWTSEQLLAVHAPQALSKCTL